MNSWEALVISLTVLNSLCVALDRLFLHRQKSRLQHFLLAYWVRLDDTDIKNLHHAVALKTLSLLRRLARPFNRLSLGLLGIVSLSMAATVIALIVGASLQSEPPFELLDFSSASWHTAGVWSYMFALNLLFDVATLLVTMFLLQRIVHHGVVLGCLFVLSDVAAAAGLGILCAWGVLLPYFAFLEDFPISPSLHLARATFLAAADFFIPGVQCRYFRIYDYKIVAYAFTTFIPTFVYATALFAAILSKPVLKATKTIFLRLLETAVEASDPKELTVFTLTGVLISAIALVTKAVLSFF